MDRKWTQVEAEKFILTCIDCSSGYSKNEAKEILAAARLAADEVAVPVAWALEFNSRHGREINFSISEPSVDLIPGAEKYPLYTTPPAHAAKDVGDGWQPTSANINALPKPLKDYICALETDADPAGTIRENVLVREENAMLRALVTEQEPDVQDAKRYRYIDTQTKCIEGWFGCEYDQTGATIDRLMEGRPA